MNLLSRCLLLIVLALSSLAASAQTSTTLVTGWNLIGNGSTATLNVADASLFGDQLKVASVWKWLPSSNKWAFYTPALTSPALSDYAVSTGYAVLTTVGAGEGFWVNAKMQFTAQLPTGTLLTSDSFKSTLVPGWNLIATGDSLTPRGFNLALGTSASSVDLMLEDFISLWAWDAAQSKWLFYAPSLAAAGGTALSDYIASKGYLDFEPKGPATYPGGPVYMPPAPRPLLPTTGFWVNKANSSRPLVVASLSKTVANPLSLVSLNGSGFNPKARLYVRFFDATGFSLEIPAASVSESIVSVAAPPYIDMASGRFGSATVSLQLVQRYSSETRLSAVIPGFTIQPLPTPPLANGITTSRWLDFAQYAVPDLKILLQQLENRYPGAPSTLALRNQITSLDAQMTLLRQAIATSIAGNPVTLGAFRGSPLILDQASRDTVDQLVYASILALGPNSPSPCSAKDIYIDQLVSDPDNEQRLNKTKADIWGIMLTCLNTQLLDLTSKAVAALGVMGVIATGAGVALSLQATAAMTYLGLAPATFVIVTQTQAVALSGPSQQAAENLQSATQLFSDSIFDPVASSFLGLFSPKASIAYDTFFASKGATEEVMKYNASVDVPLAFQTIVSQCSYSYSDWSACQSNSTQTRTVLTSSPANCVGGTQIKSQSCTYTPPEAINVAGTWSGTYSSTGPGDGGCTYNSGGNVGMTLLVSGSGFSGSSSITGIQLRWIPGCDVAGSTSSTGSVTGSFTGTTLTGSGSYPVAETGQTYTQIWTATITGTTMNGTFTGGSFTLTKQ